MFGICGTALQWFNEYITNRTQRIIIGSTRSWPIQLRFGVPQGSVLGPVLFTLYTAELSAIISQNSVDHHLYADDTQLYRTISIESRQATLDVIETCTTDIKNWMTLNKLKLNEDKTELIVFTKNKSNSIIEHISVNGTVIQRSPTVRNLGFYFDETLTMNCHVTKLCQSLFIQLRNISRIRHFLEVDTCKLLVHSLVTSRLDYCNSQLCGLPKSTLFRLQKMQNMAARIITNKKKYDHITPVLEMLHWLPVEKRIEYKIACMVFKCLTGSAPSYLDSLIKLYKPSRSLRSSNSLMLHTPFSRTKFFDRSFTNAAPRIWNSLSYKTRSSGTYESFKAKLKTELFKVAFVKK